MSEDLVDLKIAITQIVSATEANTKNIGALTNDIKELSEDLKKTLCAKHECDELKKEVDYVKKKADKLDGRISVIEGVPNAILKRFLMTVVAGVAVYIMYLIGLSKWNTLNLENNH